jgi:alkylation response protein AidB-like acyl-CoA dehydrogenase
MEMDFELNEDQTALLEAVDQLLDRRAGPARAIELQAASGYDVELHAALESAEFLEVARDPDMGLLEAALVVEAISRAAGVVSAGAAALVAPRLIHEVLEGPIALVAEPETRSPIRFAAHARHLLLLDGKQAKRVDLPEGACQPVHSNFGYPMGRVPEERLAAAEVIGEGLGPILEDAWRLSLAVELVGTMEAALSTTVAYVKQRRQFGRAIGSFQAVQHRLAECAIQVEASRWLAREAAALGAPREAVATAAAFAAQSAQSIFEETHQFSGAIGFTREHDLHVWSMRLQALRLELGGVAGHRRDLVRTRWGHASSETPP